MNIEKLLAEFSLSKENLIHICDKSSNWKFSIKKQKIHKNGKSYLSYYIVAYNAQAPHPTPKIIEKNFETQKQVKDFIMSFHKSRKERKLGWWFR